MSIVWANVSRIFNIILLCNIPKFIQKVKSKKSTIQRKLRTNFSELCISNLLLNKKHDRQWQQPWCLHRAIWLIEKRRISFVKTRWRQYISVAVSDQIRNYQQTTTTSTVKLLVEVTGMQPFVNLAIFRMHRK